MAYQQLVFDFDNSREVSYIYAGRYGAKGDKRGPKTSPTPEQIARQNQRNRENRVRRLIKANFIPKDLWATLKYPAGTKKSIEEMKVDFNKFLRKMRYRYKKNGAEFKYIYRMEVGKNGGLHIHILLNRINDTDLYIRQCWDCGHAWYTHLYEEGGYDALADYITKKPDDQVKGQISLFPKEQQDDLIRYNCSRNLIHPEPEVKEYSRHTVKKIVEKIESGDYAEIATPGYWIDKNTIRTGINPVTGMSYIHYTEYRIGGPPW